MTSTGTMKATVSDATLTYRVKIMTAIQVAKQMTNASGARASTTPAPVATPLPPEPLRNTECMCPTTGAAAMKIAYHGLKSAAASAAGRYPVSYTHLTLP